MNKKIIKIIFWIGLGLFLGWFFFQNYVVEEEDYTNFSFILEDTNEKLNGEVFFDNISFGKTENGVIKVPLLNITPLEIMFRGKYEGYLFEVYYDFPADYLDYYEVPFSLTKEEIEESHNNLEYVSFMEKDMFSGAEALHWGHMPLKYKFSDENPCGSTRRNRIIYAFNELSKVTNGTVSFVEGEDYDFFIVCNSSGVGEIYYEDGYKYTTLAEGGVDYSWGNVIMNATVNFYPLSYTGGYYPATEIHEILHGFGFEHALKACMLMSATIEDGCKPITSIDEDVITELAETYRSAS